jgi:hypothetical protein
MADEETAEKARAAMIQIIHAGYDRGAAYTNLVTLGGYAGAFAIWNYTQDDLTKDSRILIALLLGVSLATFVFFEVYKMTAQTAHTVKQVELIGQGLPAHIFLDRLAKLDSQRQLDNLRGTLKLWAAVMGISVTSALAAVSILFYNFFAILLGPFRSGRR